MSKAPRRNRSDNQAEREARADAAVDRAKQVQRESRELLDTARRITRDIRKRAPKKR